MRKLSFENHDVLIVLKGFNAHKLCSIPIPLIYLLVNLYHNLNLIQNYPCWNKVHHVLNFNKETTQPNNADSVINFAMLTKFIERDWDKHAWGERDKTLKKVACHVSCKHNLVVQTVSKSAIVHWKLILAKISKLILFHKVGGPNWWHEPFILWKSNLHHPQQKCVPSGQTVKWGPTIKLGRKQMCDLGCMKRIATFS